MRYFLDTEYNGWRGALISLALVPEFGEELYLTLDWDGETDPWVERNVIPYLDAVPDPLRGPRLSKGDAARTLSHFLVADREALIVADWPEDIAQFCNLITTGPGEIVELHDLSFQLLSLTNFSTAANSKVPHNALHDARALRDHILSIE